MSVSPPEALQISLLVAFASSFLALVLGGLAAYCLTRGNFLGRRSFELNFAVPMVIRGERTDIF